METLDEKSKLCCRLHKELSYNGIKPSVLKSAIQKYARRKQLEKGLWCLIELDLYSLVECSLSNAMSQAKIDKLDVKLIQTNVKKIRTNTINRLVVMMSEEVNICCWWLPLKIKEWFTNWNATRNTSLSRIYLSTMYRTILNCNKLRLISDLKTVFNLPPYYLKDYDALNKLHIQLISKSNCKYKTLICDTQKVNSNDLLKNFRESISSCNEEAFVWLSKLIKKENKSHLASIWNIVIANSPSKEIVESLKFFHDKMSHKEKWIYLYHAILLIIHKSKINFDKSQIAKSALKYSNDEIKDLYSENVAHKTIEIDEFIFDIHTGKKSSDNLEKFATEGAFVVDEDKTFFNQEYRELYIEFKTILDQYHENESAKKAKKRKRNEDSESQNDDDNSEIEEPKKAKKVKSSKSETKKETSSATGSKTEKNKNNSKIDKEEIKESNQSATKSKTKKEKIVDISKVDAEIESLGYKIRVIDDDEETRINALPRGQKRTATYKKAVFISPTLVYKGPYDGSDTKLFSNLRNTKILLLLESYLNCSKEEQTILDWDCLLKNQKGQYYLVSKYVGKPVDSFDYEVVSSKIEENVKIIKRYTSIKRMNEVEKDTKLITSKLGKACLQHLYLRYLLQIGDSGTYNILLREDGSDTLVCGIDMEEKNSQKSIEGKEKLEWLFKQLSAAQKTFYKPHINSLNCFKNELNETQIENLKALNVDTNELNKRILKWCK